MGSNKGPPQVLVRERSLEAFRGHTAFCDHHELSLTFLHQPRSTPTHSSQKNENRTIQNCQRHVPRACELPGPGRTRPLPALESEASDLGLSHHGTLEALGSASRARRWTLTSGRASPGLEERVPVDQAPPADTHVCTENWGGSQGSHRQDLGRDESTVPKHTPSR